jgi:hypothetical protein
MTTAMAKIPKRPDQTKTTTLGERSKRGLTPRAILELSESSQLGRSLG